MQVRDGLSVSPLRGRKIGGARGLVLFALALLAMSVAFMLSPSEVSVQAWYQSPVSPVLPAENELPSAATATPTIISVTSTPAPETLAPSDTQPSQSGGRSTAALVAGGIVLVGLVVGALVLLIRGQPSGE